MRVVFLDYDGVLNKYGERGTLREDALWRLHPEDVRMPFEPEAIGYLNAITEPMDAKIVVSSSWRTSRTLDQLRASLAWYGATAEVVATTPDLVNEWVTSGAEFPPFDECTRGTEIEESLRRNPQFTEFVILDDTDDMGRLTPCLVKTHPNLGLTVSDVVDALSRFKLSPWYARLARAADHELCPDCGAPLTSLPSGVKCSYCPYWFCF